jgi:hypothetical protein
MTWTTTATPVRCSPEASHSELVSYRPFRRGTLETAILWLSFRSQTRATLFVASILGRSVKTVTRKRHRYCVSIFAR